VSQVERWTQRPLALPALLVVLSMVATAAALMVHLMVTSAWSPLYSLDQAVLRAAEAHVADQAWLVFLFKGVSRVTVPVVYQIGAVVVAVALAWRRRPFHAAYVMVAVFAGLELAPLLKEVVRRDRPSPADPWAGSGGYSFPSGHALGVTVVALVLLVVVVPLLTTTSQRVVALAVAATAVTGVSVARVGLGVHYLSDVLAGCLIGVGWVALVTALAIPLLRREAKRHQHPSTIPMISK
jgi:undecaprenyl-diphosphatase